MLHLRNQRRWIGCLLGILYLTCLASSTSFNDCGHSTPRRYRRIVGGQASRECEFPWLVVVNVGEGLCGGSLVDPKHVITAAHCLEGKDVENGTSIRVMGGSSRVQDMQTFEVVAWRIHPHRNKQHYDFDVAVLTLAEPVEYHHCLSPLCLPVQWTKPLSHNDCWAAGWGKDFENERPRKQKKVYLPLVDSRLCKMAYFDKHIDDTKVCAGDFFRGGIDTCQGDSGGPLMCLTDDQRYVQYGIISFGQGCAEQFHPGVYTNVAHPEVLKFVVESLQDG